MNAESLKAAIQVTHTINLLWLIPFFPFLGATLNGIFGRMLQDKFGKAANHGIAIGAMTLSALVTIYAVAAKLYPLPAHERALLDVVFPMIHIGHFNVDMARPTVE